MSSLKLEPVHMDGRPKKIGTLKGKSVWHLKTKGGLHMVATQDSSGINILGSAPHRAIAAHMALKKESELELTELSKSSYVDPSTFEHLIPEYEEFTKQLNELLKKK